MSEYEAQIERWRAARYKRLTAPDGWLAVVGKTPLREGLNTVGSAEGSDVRLPDAAPARVATIELRGARAFVRPEPDAEIRCASQSQDGGRPFAPREVNPADVLVVGAVSMQLLWRGDAVAVRVKDEDALARRAFAGVPHFPVDRRWRLEARLEAFDEEREVELDYEGGATTVYRSPGFAVFRAPVGAVDEVSPEQRLLLLYETGTPRLFVLFKDATCKDETYGAGRFLYAPIPEDPSHPVILDFNTAFNPPCALTPWASCPLVPPENVLALRVEAGEKRLAEH